ncbi:MAG: hypothetical protein ACK478_03930 [Flavobacteriales bacterium]|jgi:hypothetical protein
MKKHFWLAAIFFCVVNIAFAQEAVTQSSATFIVECTNLNFEKYQVLHENVKTDGQFTIETACIPANVLCIKPLSAQAGVEAFKQLVTLSGIQVSTSRNNLTRAEFDQRCANARTGN